MRSRPLRVLLLTLASSVAWTGPLAAQTLGGRFLDAAVDSIAREHLASGQVAGLTIAVDRGGDRLHLQGYGHVDLELGVRTPLDAVYEIGSVTKQFTAVLALLLEEDGLLDLDADVSEYPPAFETGGRRIPLRRLLDHTSGMKGYTESPAVFGSIVTQALPPDTLLRLMEAEAWDFEPGEALIYNNTAYFLMGRILEEVSGSTYATLLQERILDPLGMVDTHYCDPARVVKHRARGYQASPDGMTRAPYLDHRWPFAAGSMCSSARDLVRWNQALHGGEVLQPESYRSLVTPEPLVDGTPTSYAKGLVHREDDFGDVIEHGGGIFGFLTDVRHYPDEDLTVVILQNTTGPSPGVVMDGVVSLLLPRTERQPEPYPGELSRLEGTYRGPSRGSTLEIVVEADGTSLLIRSGEGEASPLVHLGEGRFGDEASTRIWFVDAEGRPVGPSAGEPPVAMRFAAGGTGLYLLSRQVN